MDLSSYLVFVVVAFFYIISPGLAVFLTIQYSAVHDYKKVVFLILGNITGLGVIAFISAIGIGIIIASSELLTNGIKIIGAFVLIYLGVKMIINSNKSKLNNKSIKIHNSDSDFFKEGILLALSNPKPIIFFASIYPQFIEDTSNKNFQFLLLAVTFMLISFLSLNAYGILSKNTLGKVLNAKRIKIFNIASGAGLVITGVFIVIF